MIENFKTFINKDEKYKLKDVKEKEEFEYSLVCNQMNVIYTDKDGNEIEYKFLYYKDQLIMFCPSELWKDLFYVKRKVENKNVEIIEIVADEINYGNSNKLDKEEYVSEKVEISQL